MPNINLTGTKPPHIQEADKLRVALQTVLPPQTLDLATVPNIPPSPIFFGSCTDGSNAYLAPFTHSIATCIDLSNFTAANVKTIDLSTINADLSYFGGCVYSYPYVYYIPRNNLGDLVRVDVNNFTITGVSVLKLIDADGYVSGCLGGTAIANYIYMVSNNAKLIRVNTNNFTAAGVSILDLKQIDSNLRQFYGSFSVGDYLYLVPFQGSQGISGKVVKINVTKFNLSSVETLDLAAINPSLKGFLGGIVLDNYAYFVPLQGTGFNGNVARLDLNNFAASGVSYLDLSAINPLYKGFAGGITDGEYVYLSHYTNGDEISRYGHMIRIDPKDFSSTGIVDLDLSSKVDGIAAYLGGFTDGEFVYFTPIESIRSSKLIKILAAKSTFGGTL